MKAQKLTAWFVAQPIRAALLFFVPLLLILDLLFFKWPEGLNDLLIEAHGVVFDLLVFGIILAAYDHLRQKQQNIKRYQEEIDDFRRWDEKEAVYRNVGNIRRLNKEGVYNVQLIGSYLSGGNLYNANLTGANLTESNLSKTHLFQANLTGANLDEANLTEAFLSRANLTRASLYRADLSKAIFVDANLTNAKLVHAKLIRADLFTANLSNASLIHADLSHAILFNANLSGANLTDAYFFNADLNGANLSGAALYRADLTSVKGLTHEMLKSCYTLCETKGIENFSDQLKTENPELFEVPKNI